MKRPTLLIILVLVLVSSVVFLPGSPDAAPSHFDSALRALQFRPLAVAELERAIAADDRPDEARALLLILYQLMDNPEKALERAAQLPLDQYGGLNVLVGEVFHRQGDYAMARQYYEAAQKLGDYARANMGLAQLAYSRNEPETVVGLLEEAVEWAPDYTEALLLLGRAQYAESLYEESLDSLRQAYTQDPRHPVVHRYLSLVYEALDKPEEAAQSRARAEELASGAD